MSRLLGCPESERVLWKYHTVSKGDTLGAVAKKYGTTVSQLTQANNISVKSALRVGQSLVIPVSGVNPPAAQTASGVTARRQVYLYGPQRRYAIQDCHPF